MLDPRLRSLMLLLAPVSALLLSSPTRAAEVTEIPATVLWEGEQLAKVRTGRFAEDPRVRSALGALRNRAERALGRGPYSVVTHGELAASGDPHDYVSFGTYWWPNPDTANGLPYLRRDGVPNRKLLAQGDYPQLVSLRRDVTDLALAGYLLDESHSSERAALLLRTWFLDPETRMNSHLRHGQMIRGVNTGRSIGIIDSKELVWCLEAARVLERYDGWTDGDREGLREWMRAYLDWLLNDPMGQQEGNTKNNHATYYDLQVVAMALYVGDDDTARRVLEGVKRRRIATQIEPGGQQPHEEARTLSLTYSFMNLRGFCLLARMGEAVEVDLWNYRTEDGRSLRSAADYLRPYLLDPAAWPHEQIKAAGRPWSGEVGYLLATRYDDPQYLETATDNRGNVSPTDITPLVLSPPSPEGNR